jgi:hypothetical protein
MLSVSSLDLAAALAERLNEVAPPGFIVDAQDAELVIYHNGDILGVSGAPAIMETVEAIKEPRANLETAVRASLSGVQDYIAEAVTEPWPGAGGNQPNPDAKVDGATVTMWFGDEHDPVLRLRPIRLD